MRLYIIGDTHDDKGKQLEELTEALLKGSGYEYVRRNVVEAGGSEIDVTAQRVVLQDDNGVTVPVICECKAKGDPININDWLKFVGKVSIGRMNNPKTEGVMIALSGVNGNVTGNYNALPDKSFLRLIEQEELTSIVSRYFNLKDVEEVRSYFANNTTRTLDHVDIVYYEKKVWWIVSFMHDEFTIVTDNMATIEDKYLEKFLERLANYTTFKKTGYVDVLKEEMAKQRADVVTKGIVFTLMKNGEIKLFELIEELKRLCGLTDISQNELETLIESNAFVTKDCDMVRMNATTDIDFVEFYKWYDNGAMFYEGIATDFYIQNINDKLLDAIIKIQENLEIPEERKADCLYILTLSPRAMVYALQPDSVIVNSRRMGAGAIPQVNRFHSSYFMNKLADALLKDMQDTRFSSFYSQRFGLDEYSIETELTLKFVDKEFDKTIDYCNYVRFLNANGQIVPILLFDKSSSNN